MIWMIQVFENRTTEFNMEKYTGNRQTPTGVEKLKKRLERRKEKGVTRREVQPLGYDLADPQRS